MSVGGLMRQHRQALIVGAVLTVGLFLAYAGLSARLCNTAGNPYDHGDVLFDLDTPRVVGHMTSPTADHERTKVHPLYVLLVNPAGSMLARSGVLGPTRADHAAAIILNALFGALSGLLAFALFRQMSRSTLNSLLLTLVFSFSMSQIILSMIPDTPSLATLSLLVTYNLLWMSLHKREVPLSLWVIAGVFSLGVTTTNVAQTAACFGVSRLASPSSRRVPTLAWRFAAFLLPVLAITSALALVQKAIYPSSILFFLPSAYASESRFAGLLILRQPLLVLEQLVRHFLVVNVVGSVPMVIGVIKGVPAISFSPSWSFAAFGFLPLLLWAGLASFGLRLQKTREHKWFYAGLGLCLAINLLLHAFYGVREEGKIEYFLYTGNFTFLVITLLLSGYLHAPRFARLGLGLFLLALTVNNLLVVRSIIMVYDRPPTVRAGDRRWEVAEVQIVPPSYSVVVPLPQVPGSLTGADAQHTWLRTARLDLGDVMADWHLPRPRPRPSGYGKSPAGWPVCFRGRLSSWG